MEMRVEHATYEQIIRGFLNGNHCDDALRFAFKTSTITRRDARCVISCVKISKELKWFSTTKNQKSGGVGTVDYRGYHRRRSHGTHRRGGGSVLGIYSKNRLCSFLPLHRATISRRSISPRLYVYEAQRRRRRRRRFHRRLQRRQQRDNIVRSGTRFSYISLKSCYCSRYL